MVILEAARQMFLAVCEQYYAPRWPDQQFSYVFDRLESSFRNFLYPLETILDCEVLAMDIDNPQLPSFDVRVRFGQAGLRIAEVRLWGSALTSTVMARREHRGAVRAVRSAYRRATVAARVDAG